MSLLIFIILLIVCGLLGFVILIQNPKGGGITGSLGGMTNQMMGVKQTNDIMEKGTWIFAAIIGLICILSTTMLKSNRGTGPKTMIDQINTTTPAPQQQPVPGDNNTVPFQMPQSQPQPAPAPEAPAN